MAGGASSNGLGSERARRIARAKAYPFARPGHSVIIAGRAALAIVRLGGDSLEDAEVGIGGETVRLGDYLRDRGIGRPAPFSERLAVLAHGANASPGRLKQKFSRSSRSEIIPLLKAQLEDFDVVFAPHFSGYGSIPATLERSPGTSVAIAVTYLDGGQVEQMDRTEFRAVGPAYHRGRLSQITCRVDGLGTVIEAQAYLARLGSLRFDGEPRALAALAAHARRFRASSQEEMQRAALDRLAPGMELDAFIDGNVRDETLRLERRKRLADWAMPLSYPHFEVMEG